LCRDRVSVIRRGLFGLFHFLALLQYAQALLLHLCGVRLHDRCTWL
jgi:hypothetical protein